MKNKSLKRLAESHPRSSKRVKKHVSDRPLPLKRKYLKKAIIMWCEGSERKRIQAFLILYRMLKNQPSEEISFALKKLYLAYLKNIKAVRKTNLPSINFMQQCLVELYSLDLSVAYQHTFVFVRQCAIHLRNAYTAKQEDAFKPIYSWPFLLSLLLWSRLLASLSTAEVLKPLINSIVQVMTGTIKHLPQSRFYPLRFQIIKSLIKLSQSTNLFIPILPLILEVFDGINYEKKFKIVNKKEMDLNCMTRVNQELTVDKDYIEACVVKCHDLLLEYLANNSHLIAFPELVCFPILKLKKFIKKSTVAAHGKLIKKLVEKIEENVKTIQSSRKSVSFSIQDASSINQWENSMKDKGTPLQKFYQEFKVSNSSQST